MNQKVRHVEVKLKNEHFLFAQTFQSQTFSKSLRRF